VHEISVPAIKNAIRQFLKLAEDPSNSLMNLKNCNFHGSLLQGIGEIHETSRRDLSCTQNPGKFRLAGRTRCSTFSQNQYFILDQKCSSEGTNSRLASVVPTVGALSLTEIRSPY
jgi:hypothetical protein